MQSVEVIVSKIIEQKVWFGLINLLLLVGVYATAK